MEPKLKIPKYAKNAARKGLELRKRLPESKKFGITQAEANKLGIDSGVTRAERIIRNDYMLLWEAKKVSAFGSRFKNCHTPKCEGAHLIWGGRKFEKLARRWVKRQDGVKQRYWKSYGSIKLKDISKYKKNSQEWHEAMWDNIQEKLIKGEELGAEEKAHKRRDEQRGIFHKLPQAKFKPGDIVIIKPGVLALEDKPKKLLTAAEREYLKEYGGY